MKRYHSLSVYRIIAAILILHFHVLFFLLANEIPYGLLFSKFVQGLTALSGFLYASKTINDVKKFYLNNLKKLIIPALFVMLLIFALDIILMICIKDFDLMHIFFGSRLAIIEPVFQFGNYYYILYIFICYLITPILQNHKKWSIVITILTVIIELSLGYFFGIAIMATPYIIGYFIGRKAFKYYVNRDTKYSVIRLFFWLAILSISLGLYILLINISFGDSYGLIHLHSLLRNITSMTFGVATFFSFMMCFRWMNRNVDIKLFKFTDKATYMIYLLNQAFMVGITNVAVLVDELWKKILLVYIITLLVSVAFQFLYNLIFTRKKKAKIA